MKKVLITGIGMLCASGNGREAAWANIRAGKPGIGRITAFDASRCTSQVAGEVRDFQAYAIDSGLIDRKSARHMARFTQFAVATALEAWKDAGFGLPGEEGAARPDMDRVGTLFGVGIGGIEVTGESYKILFDRGPDRVSPLAVPELIPNEAAGNVSMLIGAKGPAQVISTACASSTDALGYAMDLIRSGRADVVIAGGAEACVTEFVVAGFMKMRALSSHYNETPESACRPFAGDRDGFVVGEGSATLILESEEHAKARGAKNVYCELAGYGATSDAYHITAPDPSAAGAVKAIRLALKDAGVEDFATVDYINAHGTSTALNDAMETAAFKEVFGADAAKINISSTKSMHGHLLGAAGALEASITALAIREGFVPPTINYATPDPALDLNYTPNTGVAREIRVALSSSLGFGGHNAILAFRKA